MNCSPEMIEAYMDEELDASQRAAMKEHLDSCSVCFEQHARLEEQKAGIRTMAPYYRAPEELRQSIGAALRREERKVRPMPWRGMAIAASALLAVSAAWNVFQLRPHTSAGNLVAETVLSDHIRSLIGTHLLDVVSTDQHTVKPWFNGKLDFSPDVKDFADAGFPLIGGRLEYLNDRNVAALVYQRRKHIINVFTWPTSSTENDGVMPARNGYHVVHWTQGGMQYWAVSDVGVGDLEAFQKLYER